MILKTALLSLPGLNLKRSELHKFRGYIGNLYKDENLTHNHDKAGKPIYRYPLIQYKIIDKIPVIAAITQPAIDVVAKIFLNTDTVNIAGTEIPVHEKDFSVSNKEIGFFETMITYKFIAPWLAFNSENYRTYIQLTAYEEKNELLKRILIGNILTSSAGLGIRLNENQKIKADISLRPIPVQLKGVRMSGFVGGFKTNYIIPDYLGLGKSTSRGFGTVHR